MTEKQMVCRPKWGTGAVKALPLTFSSLEDEGEKLPHPGDKLQVNTQISSDVVLNVKWLLLHCLGFGSCWGWVHVSFFSSTLWQGMSETASLEAWLANVLFNGIAMLVFGLLASWFAPFNRRKRFIGLVTLLTIIGTVGLASGRIITPDVLWMIVGPIASGVGTAGMLLLWAELYGSIAPNVAKKYTIPGSLGLADIFHVA